MGFAPRRINADKHVIRGSFLRIHNEHFFHFPAVLGLEKSVVRLRVHRGLRRRFIHGKPLHGLLLPPVVGKAAGRQPFPPVLRAGKNDDEGNGLFRFHVKGHVHGPVIVNGAESVHAGRIVNRVIAVRHGFCQFGGTGLRGLRPGLGSRSEKQKQRQQKDNDLLPFHNPYPLFTNTINERKTGLKIVGKSCIRVLKKNCHPSTNESERISDP